MRKFIKQGSAKDGTVSINLPANVYAGLILRVRGTTDTAQTLLLSSIGHIRIFRYGEQIQSESFEFYHNYDNLKGGYLPTVTAGAAAAEDIFCLVPFGLPELPNTMNVVSNDEANVKLEFSNLDTLFGSNACTYELYGYITEDIPEAYLLKIREQDVQASGSGRILEILNGLNLAALYLKDSADKIDSYSVDIDGVMIVDNIDDDVERAITGLENRIESGTLSFAEVNLVRTGNIRNAINMKTKVELIFNAAGTVNLTAFQISLP